jgi:protein-tyrosine-phosphatase
MVKTAPRSILFACTLNAVRSPMAEGLARDLLGTTIYVDSAGLDTQSVDPMAVEVMAELGIDITHHNTQSFDDLEIDAFDLIVALSPEAYLTAKELTKAVSVDVVLWPTDDPTDVGDTRQQRLDAYRAVRDGIRRRIVKAFAEKPRA